MLKVDPSLNHVPAHKEHVIALYESINQPLVNIPNIGTGATGAFILGTRNQHGYYTVFVYLYQPESGAVIVYVSQPRNLTHEQYRGEEAEGVRFVESMGFMVDNVHFPTLAPSEQEAVMARIPMFRPPERPVDLYDVAREHPSSSPGPRSGNELEDTEALFGGLSAADGELFRMMGGEIDSSLPKGPPPIPQSGRQNTPLTPSSDSMRPRSNSLQSGLPAQQDPFGRRPSGTPAPAPMTQPHTQPNHAPSDGEALKRIGRLLGTFGLLACLWSGPLACATTPLPSRSSIDSQLDLGNQQLAGGSFAKAIKEFEKVLEMEEENQFALSGLGLSYFYLGRMEQAENYLREAISIAAHWSEPKNTLAAVLIAQKRCPEAEKLLRAVLDDIHYPTPHFAADNLAKALSCQNKEGAVAVLKEAVRKEPRFCLGYMNLSKYTEQQNLHEETIEACEGFVQHCEKHAEIKKQISPKVAAVCYLRKGKAYAAIGDVESARSAFMRCNGTGQLQKECAESMSSLPQ